MKNKTRIIILAVILLVAAAIAVAYFHGPPVMKRIISGTFAKAEKYNKQNISEKDILLRTELTNDTVRLRLMIRSILTIEKYNATLARQIDTIMGSLRSHPIMFNPKFIPPIISLKDFGSWLVISNTSIQPVSDFLVQLYTKKDSIDQSVDVENNLRGFVRFISQLSVRDALLGNAARAIDRYIDMTEKKKLPGEQNSGLTAIRNQLLADHLLTAAMLGDKATFEKLSHYIEACDARDQEGAIAQIVNTDYYVILTQMENAVADLNNSPYSAFCMYIELNAVGQFGLTEIEVFQELNRIEPQAFDQLLFAPSSGTHVTHRLFTL